MGYSYTSSQHATTIHLRVNGLSQDVSAERLRVSPQATREEVLQAAARYLDMRPEQLRDYAVDTWPGHLVVRPPAVFG